MLDEITRAEIVRALESLAAQDTWNDAVWQRCYDLVSGNIDRDDLVAYLHDDLIHYSGRPLFRSTPRSRDFQPYRQEFRDIAAALGSHMSLADYKKNYE